MRLFVDFPTLKIYF